MLQEVAWVWKTELFITLTGIFVDEKNKLQYKCVNACRLRIVVTHSHAAPDSLKPQEIKCGLYSHCSSIDILWCFVILNMPTLSSLSLFPIFMRRWQTVFFLKTLTCALYNKRPTSTVMYSFHQMYKLINQSFLSGIRKHSWTKLLKTSTVQGLVASSDMVEKQKKTTIIMDIIFHFYP